MNPNTKIPAIAEDEIEELTREQIERALPPSLRTAATQEFADKINGIVSDPTEAQAIRENFISYTSVLKDGKFKSQDYLNAIVYVSYKLMSYSNDEAYARTFPKRYEELLQRGGKKAASSFVAAYHKNKLVNLILEQTLTPLWLLNIDVQQKAINQLAFLMMNAGSEKVQSDSAAALLQHLKRPEPKELNLNVGVQESGGLRELNKALLNLAEMQQTAINNGTTTRDIAALPIHQPEEAEYTEVND